MKHKTRNHPNGGGQREDKPKDRRSGGKSGFKKLKELDMINCQTPLHTDKKEAQQGIASSLVDVQFEKGQCAPCGMDNHGCKFSRKSIVSSSRKRNSPKPKNDHAKDVWSTAGEDGNKPKPQATRFRLDYEANPNDERIQH
jgi:hypothetical protein